MAFFTDWRFWVGEGGCVALLIAVVRLCLTLKELRRATSMAYDHLRLSNQRLKAFAWVLRQASRLPELSGLEFQRELTRTLDGVTGFVVQLLCRRTGVGPSFCRTAIMEYLEGSVHFMRHGYGYGRNGLDSYRGPDPLGEIARSRGECVYVRDLLTEPSVRLDTFRGPACRTVMCVPLHLRGCFCGVVNIDSDEADALSEEDQDLVRFAAGIVEICLAIEAARHDGRPDEQA